MDSKTIHIDAISRRKRVPTAHNGQGHRNLQGVWHTAFGIHLILTTQRPDANILSGQIKNNVNCRICGRADTVLSQIILDSTAAAEQIPKDARGRFILHDGTVFQAYWFDDTAGITSLHS